MTEEQKNCEYCNIKPGVYNSGGNFGNKTAWFQIRKQNDICRIGAWCSDDGNVLDMESVTIRYCPMCGRKLGKEGQR